MRRILLCASLAACGHHGNGGNSDTVSCESGEIACNGVCVVADSCDFAVTGIDTATGFLNGGEWHTITGAGFGDGLRVYLGDGFSL